jgi:3'-phosphoadenosine 5'-phosphosulfate (PAPS) 3'-phosphatase
MSLLLTRLVAASVQASQKAAKIIRDIKQSGCLDTMEKAKNDYVTKADFQSQLCIIKSLESLFPRIRFCGEEGELKGSFNDLDVMFNDDVLKILNDQNVGDKCPSYLNIQEEEVKFYISFLNNQ